MKNGSVTLSPMPSNAGSWFGRRHAATECEVDLALMAKSNEQVQTLDSRQAAVGSRSLFFGRMKRVAVDARRRSDRALRRLPRKVPEGERNP
jgi:hypothetical protein